MFFDRAGRPVDWREIRPVRATGAPFAMDGEGGEVKHSVGTYPWFGGEKWHKYEDLPSPVLFGNLESPRYEAI